MNKTTLMVRIKINAEGHSAMYILREGLPTFSRKDAMKFESEQQAQDHIDAYRDTYFLTQCKIEIVNEDE